MLLGPKTITEEIVGDVAILRVDGRLTIGESSEILHDCLERLLSAGQQKILVDLAGVPQIDSLGIATITRASIALNGRGGALKLSVKPGRVNDAFIVTKLAEYINIFPSVEVGLRAFAAAPFYCFCPICGSRSEPPAQNEKSLYWRPQTCIRCDCQFTVTSGAQGAAILKKINILPYGKEDEYVEILPGSPVRLMVVGRLDLFSSRALQDALHAIPVPRIVAIDLARTTEISDGGRDVLLTLLASIETNDKIVVSLEGLGPDRLELLSNLSKLIHLTKNAAFAALGRVPKKSSWLVRVDTA